ncbi:MAG: lipoprotein-releasing system permease protein [Algoriphagus sp.]|jgi:lipoprotein-releasing system permease protein
MNLSFHIAKKYFFSGKKRSFIHFISIISMIGVCVGTAALIIVLSVFNGLEDLNRSIFKSSDPDIKISSSVRKTFLLDPEILRKIRSLEGIDHVIQVLQDNALAKRDKDQVIVVVKGVDSTFQNHSPLSHSVIEGELLLQYEDENYAFVGGGIYHTLNLQCFNYLRQLELWYPRNQKLNVLNPESNISKVTLPISGSFVLEQAFDNHMYIPLELMETLTNLKGKRTSFEITATDQNQISKLKSDLKTIMGKGFDIKDRDEQNASLYRAIKIEKLFIFIALLFIIGIASFNIFFALSMLVLDKKEDIKTLSALGADKALIQRIFLSEGAIISMTGGTLGLILGVGICWSQMYFGWLKMGMEFAIVDAYPILLKGSDVLISVIGIVIIAFLASYFPSRKAVKFMNESLKLIP